MLYSCANMVTVGVKGLRLCYACCKAALCRLIRSHIAEYNLDQPLAGRHCYVWHRTSSRLKGRIDSTGLSEYAKHCLREICSQEWVREKFLKEPEHLFTVDLLLDKMLSNCQVSTYVI